MAETEEKVGKKDEHVKVYTIIVNAKEKEFKGNEISFDQVIVLAFGTISTDPSVAYTVTYKRGHGNKPEGSMVKGDVVMVKEGMIFNATMTNKS